MAAFSAAVSADIQRRIQTLTDRARARIELDITPSEILRLVANEETRAVCTKAAEYCRVSSYTSDRIVVIKADELGYKPLPTKNVELNIYVLENRFFIPKHINIQTHETEIISKLVAYAKQHVELGIEWGRVRAVVNHLTTECSNPAQVRYYLPGILVLLRMGEEPSQNVAARIADFKAPRSMPPFPPEVRKACDKVAHTLALAQLTADTQPDVPTKPIKITMPSIYHATVNEDGFVIYTI